jgi:aspartate kinase
MAALNRVQERVGFSGLFYDDHIGKISLWERACGRTPGSPPPSVRPSATAGVNIEIISTSRFAFRWFAGYRLGQSVRAVHEAFEPRLAEEAVVYAGTGR